MNKAVSNKISVSIDDFSNKKFISTHSIEDSQAILTHYLHNVKNGASKNYKKEAINLVKEYVSYASEESGSGMVEEAAMQQLLFEMDEIPFKSVENYSFTFIDLFAGIGGFRIAMQNLGGKCVFTSEWDKDAQKTYRANFGEVPFGDITKESVKRYIPQDFDVLCAGFPCQAFSIAGKRGGFEDTRGTLFFDVAEIISKNQPKAIFLENVKGLTTHDGGKTFEVIINTLEDLGYKVFYKIINAKDFGVPQNRERIFIIGFNIEKMGSNVQFDFPEKLSDERFIGDFIEEQVDGYSISKHLQNSYIFKKEDGRPQIVDKNSKLQVKTLVSTYHKIQRLTGTFVKGGETGLRLLTINECKAIMGFPKRYLVPVSRTQAYRQFGNSVAIPAIQAAAKEMISIILGK